MFYVRPKARRPIGRPRWARPGRATRAKHGYLFRGGKQDNRLEITLVEDGLRFVDTGTPRFRKLARVCRKESVPAGIAAVCPMPKGATEEKPVLLEYWPRLGDDHLDASTLPATIAVTMLGDKGNDVARFGAGPDFFNGHIGADRVWGGDGNDWNRSGHGPDQVWGGAGDDQLVAMAGNDVLHGEAGNDLLGGGPGRDDLDGGPGADLLRCNGGVDRARTDGEDRVRDCEELLARVRR